MLGVLFLLFASAHGLALNLPEELSGDGISNSVTLALQQNNEQDQLQTPNASENNTYSPEEQRRAMLYSIQQHIMAKLNLRELPPQDAPSDPDFELPPALLASYYAHVESLKQGAEDTDKCSEEETTHFSRHTKLYYPERYVSEEPNAHRFQLTSGDDEKGEEIKHSDKDKIDDGNSKASSKSQEASSISPVLYNLRFDGLDFSDRGRLWSIKLQLYKRKVTLGENSKRGTNPVDAVKVFRVIRTFDFGQSVKKYVLLASKSVPSEDEGYVSFNITSGVKNWLASSTDETTLELDVQIDTPQRVDTGLSFPPAVAFDIPFRGKGEHNARLLVERLNEIERVGTNREHDNLYRRRKRQTVQGVNSEYCHDNPSTSSCCIRNLTVNFHELGLTQVIFPTTYQPNYCQGECRLNTASATRSTSFLMQLRETNPTAAAEPCCVAHKTRPLTVFMNIDGQVQLRDIPDMIVESCICR